MRDWRDTLLQVFRSKVELNEDECNALRARWQKIPRPLRRNDFLIQKGKVETNLYFVISGSMRIYFPHGEEEICVGFAYDNNLICSYPSFIQQKPSGYYIQALKATEVAFIAKQDFYQLFENYPRIERAWRMLEEEALIGKIERETEMLTYTPEERYHRLLARSPQIFTIIPRKYIASYLRMTPETLSRISAR